MILIVIALSLKGSGQFNQDDEAEGSSSQDEVKAMRFSLPKIDSSADALRAKPGPPTLSLPKKVVRQYLPVTARSNRTAWRTFNVAVSDLSQPLAEIGH